MRTLINQIHISEKRDILDEVTLDSLCEEAALNLDLVDLEKVACNAVELFFLGLDLEAVATEAEKIKENRLINDKDNYSEFMNVSAEFLESEDTFLAHLYCYMENFIIPLKTDMCGVDKYTFDLLFGGIEELSVVIETIVRKLKDQSKNGLEDLLWGQVFLEHWEKLKQLLKLRFENFLEAMRCLDDLTKKCPEFQSVLDTSPLFPSLGYLVLAPVHCLTRYRLFFSSLWHEIYDDPDHADYENLDTINKEMSNLHEYLKLVSIEKSFLNYDLHLTPKKDEPPDAKVRELYLEGTFQIYDGRSKREAFVFMFDDILITASRDDAVQGALTYKFETSYRYDQIWTHWSKSEKNIFRLGFPTTEFRYRAIDEGVRVVNWYTALKELETNAKKQSNKFRGTLKMYIDNLNDTEPPPQEAPVTISTTTHDLRSLFLPLFGVSEKRFTKYTLLELVDGVEREMASYECPLMLEQYYEENKIAHKFVFRFTIEEYQGVDGDKSPNKDLQTLTKTLSKRDKIRRFSRMPNPFSNKAKKTDTNSFEELDKERKQLFFGLNYCEFVNTTIEELIQENENIPRESLALEIFIPPALQSMMFILYRDGPDRLGIFRKSAHRATVQLVQDTLNEGKDYDILSLGSGEVASLAKAFFRSLPECIFTEELYPDLLAIKDQPEENRVKSLQCLMDSLPAPNFRLISVFCRVLHKVAIKCDSNNMTAENLAICVGPSMLFAKDRRIHETTTEIGTVHMIVVLLINNCERLFGSNNIEIFEEIIINDKMISEDNDDSEQISEHTENDKDRDSQSGELSSNCNSIADTLEEEGEGEESDSIGSTG